MKDSLVQELQQKAEEAEMLQMELQMLETERARLSLVEEKLVDVLQLLQQLRDLVSQTMGAYYAPADFFVYNQQLYRKGVTYLCLGET